MKKKSHFDLLVDIFPLVQQIIEKCSDSTATVFKNIFKDQYEIWRYTYNKDTKLYELDSCIYSRSSNEIIRFANDPRISKAYSYLISHKELEKLQHIRHFSSIASAQLTVTIEGKELFISKRPSDSIPVSISFGEILKKWKRLV